MDHLELLPGQKARVLLVFGQLHFYSGQLLWPQGSVSDASNEYRTVEVGLAIHCMAAELVAAFVVVVAALVVVVGNDKQHLWVEEEGDTNSQSALAADIEGAVPYIEGPAVY